MSENLVSKLLKAQKELKAPKGNYNSFGKYKYRSAEDILEAVKPLNAEYGLLLTLTDEPILIGEWHYIKATATITDGENTHTVSAYARESLEKKGMDHSQITGTASSYARKYALNGLYLIDDTKDADTDEYQNQSNNSKQNNKPQPQNDPLNDEITLSIAEAIKVAGSKGELLKKLGMTGDEVNKIYKSKKKGDKEKLIQQIKEIS